MPVSKIVDNQRVFLPAAGSWPFHSFRIINKTVNLQTIIIIINYFL
jgi:hypothetical protein